MSYKITSLLGLAFYAMVSGHAISEQKVVRYYGELGHIGDKAPEHHEEYAWAYPAYEFSYFVEDKHTHDMKGQEESRHGDEVKGKYWLIQPDGRKRTVTYHANKKDGFKANVEYSDPHHEHVQVDHKPIVEDPDHKTEIEHIPENNEPVHVEHNEPKHVEHHEPEHVEHHEPKHVEHRNKHNIENIEHKPIVVIEPNHNKPHYKMEPVHHKMEPVHHEMEPVHERKDHDVESHRVPIPPLAMYIPRRHRIIENYHHPRDNRRH
ncbi:unnamed protein product [Chilo suppressalis]|uniref:Cuticle protein n=1 Tax=Chilo suppressalis TaxID=168631 RepID=A0ABN8LDK1_CHISP|nr:unnamed protein product [Chilo suppressalis]